MISLFEMPRAKEVEKPNLQTDVIICGDCLTVLRNMPSESIDLIFTSPPYADNRKKLIKVLQLKITLNGFYQYRTS